MKINVRDQRNGNWYWVARTIYQDYASKIGVIGLALYNAYASYAFDKQKVFPSQTTIAEKLSISIPALIKYNKILVKHKLIRIYKRKGEVSIITLLYVVPLNLVKGSTKPRLGVPLNLVKGNKKNRIKRTNKKSNTFIIGNIHPSIEDIRQYIKERKILNVIANQFYKWYKDNSFKDMNGKPLTMLNFKAKINTWSIKNKEYKSQKKQGNNNLQRKVRLTDPQKETKYVSKNTKV